MSAMLCLVFSRSIEVLSSSFCNLVIDYERISINMTVLNPLDLQ